MNNRKLIPRALGRGIRALSTLPLASESSEASFEWTLMVGAPAVGPTQPAAPPVTFAGTLAIAVPAALVVAAYILWRRRGGGARGWGRNHP